MLTSWTWSKTLDPAPAPVDSGALQLLSFNVLMLILIFVLTWAAKKLYLGEHDSEVEAATEKLTPLQRVMLENIQWFALFAFVAFVLLRGL